MSPVQQASLEYGKAYIQQIEILQYIDFVKKKNDLNTVVYVVALLYFTACGTLYYYNIFFF